MPKTSRTELDRAKSVRSGCLELRRARSTGTIVGLYKAEEARLDTEGGPYVTVCEDHGHLVNHATRTMAERHLSRPDEWCAVCQGEDPPEEFDPEL